MVCREEAVRFNSSRYRPMWRSSSDMSVPEFFQRRQRAAAYFGVPRLLIAAEVVAGCFVKRRQQIEGDIGRLVIGAIGARDVVAERAERGLARERPQRLPV